MKDFITWVKNWIWLVIILSLWLITTVASVLEGCESHRRKQKLEEINAAIDGMIAQPVLLDVLDDSSRVYSAPVATVSRSNVKKLLPSKSLLKDINVKSSQVAAVDITANEVCDSVKMQSPTMTNGWTSASLRPIRCFIIPYATPSLLSSSVNTSTASSSGDGARKGITSRW